MGLKFLPENVLKRISREQRYHLGAAGRTAAEAAVVADTRSEKQLQQDMANLLEQREIFYLRARMDRKTTMQKGTPDFLIFFRNGRFLAVEAKVKGGVLSADQVNLHHRFLLRTGEMVQVVTNLEQFKQLLDERG